MEDIFNIEVNAHELVEAIYDAYIPEPPCLGLLTTRGAALDSFLSVLRSLCNERWNLLDKEIEGMFRLYQGKALDNQEVAYGDSYDDPNYPPEFEEVEDDGNL